MHQLLIHNARLLGVPNVQTGWVLTEGELIHDLGGDDPPESVVQRVAPENRINAEGLILAPGLIDVHVHGARGCDTMDATPESLLTMARFFAQQGVTSFFPTTLTRPHDHLMRALRTVQSVMNQPTGGARIRGAHLEGPYLNAKLIGAQNPAYVRRADQRSETRELLDLGVIQRITIAPEFPENHAFIQEAAGLGIAVSAGHTEATPDDLKTAIDLGLRHTTHTFNAMAGLHHRTPGTVGAAMAFDELTCELIPDGVHVHPVAMRALYNAKGISRLILITDAMAGTGMPDGAYQLGGLDVTVAERKATLANTTTLAGSILTFAEGIRNFLPVIQQDLTGVWWLMTSRNAAKAHPNCQNMGQIAVGKAADLILIDLAGTIQRTMVAGEIVYSATQ
jgi:N-acetylglucosamine-6-phosphate deacetylase